MDKIGRIIDLFDEIEKVKKEKKVVVMEQKYVEAADLRDYEKRLIDEIDELVGVSGYYNDLIKLEKMYFHLDNLKNSLEGLKKLDYRLKGEKLVEVNSEALISVQRKVMDVQNDIINFRKNVGLPEKK